MFHTKIKPNLTRTSKTLALSFLVALIVQTLGGTAWSSPETLDQLKSIQKNVVWLEKEIESKKTQISHSRGYSADTEEELSDLQSRLKKARLNFLSTAAGIELGPPEGKDAGKKRDLPLEIQQLIEPLLDAVRRVSEKPRRIESYQTKIYYAKQRLANYDKAVASLEQLVKDGIPPDLQQAIADSKEFLTRTREETQVYIFTLERKLGQDLQDHRTLFQTVTDTLTQFLSTEGKNLAIALLVFFLVFSGIMSLKKFIVQKEMVVFGIHGLHRAIEFGYSVLAGVTAGLAVLLALYILHDWLMVTLLILTFLALFWGSKAWITHFMDDIKLVCNLGPVKEGERVSWMGVPWLIKTLGFQCVLTNEALGGAVVRLPASLVRTLHSRPVIAGEAWFPSSIGDTVVLSDGTDGEIVSQTPESVIVLTGKAYKHFTTINYLALSPHNLSRGFKLTAELSFRMPLQANPEDNLLVQIHSRLMKDLPSALRAFYPEPSGDLPMALFVTPLEYSRVRVSVELECPGSWASQRGSLGKKLIGVLHAAWERAGLRD